MTEASQTEAPPCKFWSAGKSFGSLLLAILVIVLAFWRPWYSRENAARIDELRNNVPELAETSIAEYLKENPARRDDAIFHNAVPVEYRAFDNAVFYAAIAGGIWLPLMLALLIYRTAKSDRARGRQLYTLVCPYCSHVIAENVLSLGQTMTCPNCRAIVQAKDKRWLR
jgi:hypothetical protein